VSGADRRELLCLVIVQRAEFDKGQYAERKRSTLYTIYSGKEL
jgi:hypothetical protein